jgi:hypothetical protein
MLLIPFVDAMLVFIVARQKFPIGLIFALGMGYFLLVAPFVGTMREEKQVAGLKSERDFVAVASESIEKSEFGVENTNQLYGILSTLDRAGPRMLGTIVEMTGGVAPFDEGATYAWAIETIVPRVLWPEKPPTNVGNYVGRKYLILSDDDLITGVSPGLIGEMYMNFGTIGSLVGMFLLGIVTVLVQEFLLTRVGTGGLAFCYTGYFFSQESAIAHCVIPAIKSYLVLFIGLAILRFASSLFQRSKMPEETPA